MEKYRIKEMIINGIKYYKLQKRILWLFWIDVRLPVYTIGESTKPEINWHNPIKTLEHWSKEGYLSNLYREYREYYDREIRQYRNKYLTITPETTNKKALEDLKDWFTGNIESYYPGLVRAGYILQKREYRTRINDIGIAYIATDTHELRHIIGAGINWEIELFTFLADDYYNGYKDFTAALEVAKRSSELHKDYERRAQDKKKEYYRRRNPENADYIR